MNKQMKVGTMRLASITGACAVAGGALADAMPMPADVVGFAAAVPSGFGAALWAPALVLLLGCVAGLLWLIVSDRSRASQSRVQRRQAWLRSHRAAHSPF
jgi:hypothetical protein